MKDSETFRPCSHEKWITISIWAVAFLLLFTRPWQVSVFKLNIEIFMFSTFGPTWAFLLVCLLAVFLRIFRGLTKKWSGLARTAFALGFTLLLALPQIDLIMLYLETYRVRFPPSYLDPMRVVMLWATPMAFFCLPALPVIWAWLNRNRIVSTVRALGISLVIFGILYIPFGLILNQLIMKYTQP